MKSLQTLQTLARIGRVLSKIVFIFCIVGAVLCVVGAGLFAAFGDQIFEYGAVSIQGLIDSEGAPAAVVYYMTGIAFVTCVLEAILSKKAERYFVHELAAGTPFTMEGARELQSVGILSMVFPVVLAIVSSIGLMMIDHVFTESAKGDMSMSFEIGGFGLGIGLIIVAVIFRYGASILQAQREQSPEIDV